MLGQSYDKGDIDLICRSICAQQIKSYAILMRDSLTSVYKAISLGIDDRKKSRNQKSEASRSDLDSAVSRLRNLSTSAGLLSRTTEFAGVVSEFNDVVRSFWLSVENRLEVLIADLMQKTLNGIDESDIQCVATIVEEHNYFIGFANHFTGLFHADEKVTLPALLQPFVELYTHPLEMTKNGEVPIERLNAESAFVCFQGIGILLGKAAMQGKPYSADYVKNYARGDKQPPHGIEQLPKSEVTGKNRRKLFRLSYVLKWIDEHPDAKEEISTVPKDLKIYDINGIPRYAG